jgi:hypothetical protein
VEKPARVVRRVREALDRAHRDGPVAEDLYLLVEVHGLGEDREVAELAARFRAAVAGSDTLVRTLEYAVRLAGAPGDLLGEEMYKLVSLCDEAQALRYFGFAADPALEREFAREVRARFAVQRAAAHVAAQHLVEPWSRDRWWYAENLSRAARRGAG